MSPAFAGGGACPTAPTNWDAASCLVGGTAVCDYVGTTWTCDLQARGGAVTLHVVEDYSSGSQLEAWGDVGGTAFCCSTGPVQATKVLVLGSAYADTLSFSALAATYNLGVTGSAITEAQMYGYAGADTLLGSESTLSTYAESFYGGNDADLIKSGDGEDVLYGEDGEDTLMGFGGDDYMSGGPMDDTLMGGAGDDLMYGDEGRDLMTGGSDNDEMDGGTGSDVMCGGSESGAPYDVLHAGDADSESPLGDALWPSAPATDEADCDNGANTRWGQSGISTVGSCSATYLLTSAPTACP